MKVFYAKKKFERKKFTFRLAEFVVNTNATYGIQKQKSKKNTYSYILIVL